MHCRHIYVSNTTYPLILHIGINYDFFLVSPAKIYIHNQVENSQNFSICMFAYVYYMMSQLCYNRALWRQHKPTKKSKTEQQLPALFPKALYPTLGHGFMLPVKSHPDFGYQVKSLLNKKPLREKLSCKNPTRKKACCQNATLL